VGAVHTVSRASATGHPEDTEHIRSREGTPFQHEQSKIPITHPTYSPPQNAQSSFDSQSVCLSLAMPDAKQKWRRTWIFGERTHTATSNPRHSIRIPSQYPIPISMNSSHPSIAVPLPLARTIFGGLVWFWGFGFWWGGEGLWFWC